MALYHLSSGHSFGFLRKLGNGDLQTVINGNFERGEGVLSHADAQKLLHELMGLLDVRAVTAVPPGTADEFAAVVDEE